MHRSGKQAMNQRMNRAAGSVLHDVDVVVWVVDRAIWTEEDQQVLERLSSVEQPVILAINKIDEIADKSALLPLISTYADRVFLLRLCQFLHCKKQGWMCWKMRCKIICQKQILFIQKIS
jgi:GTPase Era involved in 16S rRNA processing